MSIVKDTLNRCKEINESDDQIRSIKHRYNLLLQDNPKDLSTPDKNFIRLVDQVMGKNKIENLSNVELDRLSFAMSG